jgi:O-antigen ligase
MNKLNFDSSLNFLFLLMPVSFIAGPAIINLNIFMLFINYIIISLIRKDYNFLFIFKNKFFLFFFAFYTYIIFLSLFSNDVIFSLKSTLPFIKFIFIFLAFDYLKSNNILSFNFTIIVFASVVLFVLFDSLIQIIFGFNFFLMKPVYGQISGIFGNEQILGSYLSRSLVILASFLTLINYKNKNTFFLIVLLILISGFVILFSGERTALFNFFLFLFFVSFFKILKINLLSFISIISVFLISTLIILNNTYLYDRYVQTNLDEFQRFNNTFLPMPDHYSLHYITAYKMFIDYPIIGIGPNMFRKHCNDVNYLTKGSDYFVTPELTEHITGVITPEEIDNNALSHRINTLNGCSTHPHNMHIQILTELGITGYLFFITFIIYTIYKFFRYQPKTIIDKLLLIGILINFFPLIPTGNIFASYFNFLIFLPILFFYSKKNI